MKASVAAIAYQLIRGEVGAARTGCLNDVAGVGRLASAVTCLCAPGVALCPSPVRLATPLAISGGPGTGADCDSRSFRARTRSRERIPALRPGFILAWGA